MINDIYNLQMSFEDEFEGACFQNCILQILRYYNIDYPELYINYSMTTVMKYNSIMDFNIYFNNKTYGLSALVDNNMFRTDENRSTEEVWLSNKHNIESGVPIIVCVDGFYLNYLPYYQKQHCRHNIILAGYNKTEVYVVDWYKSWFFKGNVLLKDFLKARESENEFDGGIYSGIPIRNNWAILIRENWNVSKIDLIVDTLETSIKNYYSDNTNANEICGINVYKKILAILKIVIDSESEDNSKMILSNIHKELYCTINRKRFFAFWLKEISQYYKKSVLIQQALSTIVSLVSEWEKIRAIVIKLSIVYKKQLLNKVICKLDQIIQMEYILKKYIIDLNEVIQQNRLE